MNTLAVITGGNGTENEIDFYNYHAVDIMEIILKDTGISEFMTEKIALLEKKLQEICS